MPTGEMRLRRYFLVKSPEKNHYVGKGVSRAVAMRSFRLAMGTRLLQVRRKATASVQLRCHTVFLTLKEDIDAHTATYSRTAANGP